MKTTARWCRAANPARCCMMPGRSPQRVVRMVQDGAVVSVTGKVIKMRTDTVCIHGDTPGAVDIARGVRQALKDARYRSGAVQELSESDALARALGTGEPTACRTLTAAMKRERAVERGGMQAAFRSAPERNAHKGAGGLPPIVRA